MIEIRESATADTRTCDFTKVTEDQLFESSLQHIEDVRLALRFFADRLLDAAAAHDRDKLTDIAGFHADFVTGFKQTGWWDRHRRLNRHHLTQDDGIPADVNLVDVLDFISDCVMAGMGRSGDVYPLHLPPELLERAFQNTVAVLKSNVVVKPMTAPDAMRSDEAALARAVEALERVRDYFDQRADAEATGDPATYHGNREMHLLRDCDEILSALRQRDEAVAQARAEEREACQHEIEAMGDMDANMMRQDVLYAAAATLGARRAAEGGQKGERDVVL